MPKFRDKYQAEILAGILILSLVLFVGGIILYARYENGLKMSVKDAVVTSKGYYITNQGIPIYTVTITGHDRNGTERSFDYRVDHDDYRRATVGKKW